MNGPNTAHVTTEGPKTKAKTAGRARDQVHANKGGHPETAAISSNLMMPKGRSARHDFTVKIGVKRAACTQ